MMWKPMVKAREPPIVPVTEPKVGSVVGAGSLYR